MGRWRIVSKELAAKRMPDLLVALGPYEIQKHSIERLVLDHSLTKQKALDRISAMESMGIPVKGLTFKLGMTNPRFKDYLRRMQGKHKFNKTQEGVYDYLKNRGVSEKVAVKVAKSPLVRPSTVKDKVSFFESMKLDIKKYGVDRIPIRYYESMLAREVDLMKRSYKQVLFKLEDDYAKLLLKGVFPQWKKSKVLVKSRPATILDKVRACIGARINITVAVLSTYSAEQIRKQGVNLKHARPLGTKRGKNWSVINHKKRVSEFEKKALGLTAEINQIMAEVSGMVPSEYEFVRSRIGRLENERSKAVKGMWTLLAE